MEFFGSCTRCDLEVSFLTLRRIWGLNSVTDFLYFPITPKWIRISNPHTLIQEFDRNWPILDVNLDCNFRRRYLKWSVPIYWSSLDFSIASLKFSFAFSNFSNFGAFGNFDEFVKPRRVHNLTKPDFGKWVKVVFSQSSRFAYESYKSDVISQYYLGLNCEPT